MSLHECLPLPVSAVDRAVAAAATPATTTMPNCNGQTGNGNGNLQLQLANGLAIVTMKQLHFWQHMQREGGRKRDRGRERAREIETAAQLQFGVLVRIVCFTFPSHCQLRSPLPLRVNVDKLSLSEPARPACSTKDWAFSCPNGGQAQETGGRGVHILVPGWPFDTRSIAISFCM